MKSMSVLLLTLLVLTAGCNQSSKPDSKVSDAAHTPASTIEDPFPNASEVRLFVEVGYDKDTGSPILNKTQGVILSKASRERFEHTLVFVPVPEVMTACFIPHHFFRYFDSKGKQVGEVEVCFCCAGTTASGSDKLDPKSDEMLSADYKALEKLVLELGEPTDILCDY